MDKRIEITKIPDECFERLMRDVQVTMYKSGIKSFEMIFLQDQDENEIGCEFECDA